MRVGIIEGVIEGNSSQSIYNSTDSVWLLCGRQFGEEAGSELGAQRETRVLWTRMVA